MRHGLKWFIHGREWEMAPFTFYLFSQFCKRILNFTHDRLWPIVTIFSHSAFLSLSDKKCVN